MNNKTKFIILIVVTLLLTLGFFFLLFSQRSNLPEKEYEEPTFTIQGQEVELPQPEASSSSSELIEQISGITYEYEDEFMPGKPQTYTFYSSGILIIAFWEETDNETIKVGQEQCTFTLKKDNKTLRIHYADGTNDTFTFEVQNNGREIAINDIVYTKSKLKVGEMD